MSVVELMSVCHNRGSVNRQVSVMDPSSAFSSLGSTCKLQTISKQAFEGERSPDGSVQHSLRAACVTMQTAISFKGRIIKYLIRFTRRCSACSRSRGREWMLLTVFDVCNVAHVLARVRSIMHLCFQHTLFVNYTSPLFYICWGVPRLCTSLSAVLPLCHKAPTVTPAS